MLQWFQENGFLVEQAPNSTIVLITNTKLSGKVPSSCRVFDLTWPDCEQLMKEWRDDQLSMSS